MKKSRIFLKQAIHSIVVLLGLVGLHVAKDVDPIVPLLSMIFTAFFLGAAHRLPFHAYQFVKHTYRIEIPTAMLKNFSVGTYICGGLVVILLGFGTLAGLYMAIGSAPVLILYGVRIDHYIAFAIANKSDPTN
jgi:hypothetical protein